MPITPRVMAESAKIQTVNIPIVTQSAGVDSADIPFFVCPKDITIVNISVLPHATVDEHADGSVILIEKGSTTIASRTYGTDLDYTAATEQALTLVAAQANQVDGSVLTYSITNGAGASNPALTLQMDYFVNESV
jgi:hypothetical protein